MRRRAFYRAVSTDDLLPSVGILDYSRFLKYFVKAITSFHTDSYLSLVYSYFIIFRSGIIT